MTVVKVDDATSPASVDGAVFQLYSATSQASFVLANETATLCPSNFAQLTISEYLATQPWFDQVFDALAKKKVDAAVIPIENTLRGSIYENYDLLLKHDFVITGETNVRIVHNLIAPPGMKFSDVKKVYSHTVALYQCIDFFAANPQMEKEVFYDTAGSVKLPHMRR